MVVYLCSTVAELVMPKHAYEYSRGFGGVCKAALCPSCLWLVEQFKLESVKKKSTQKQMILT